MKRSPKPFRIRSPLQDNILSLTAIVTLIVLTLASVGGVLWLMNRVGLLSYDRSLFDPPTTEAAAHPGENGVFDMLRPGGSDHGTAEKIIRFSGSFSTLRSLLSDLDIPDDYRASFETTLYSGNNSAVSTIHVYRSGNAFRINRHTPDILPSGMPNEVYICDGSAVVYTDTVSQKRVKLPVSDAFSMEAIAGIPSIASFNAVPDDRIFHASYTELDGEIVYYVLYTTPTSADKQIVHEIWISADTELVRRWASYLCPADADPLTVIGDSDACLSYSEMTFCAPLSDREKRGLYTLPEVIS